MKINLLKELVFSLVLMAGASFLPGCTKEDDGLTEEARAAVEKLKGDYGLRCVTWSPETKSSVLVLIDTTEAKTTGGASVSVDGKDGAYDKGTIRVEIPFYHFLSNFFTFFNRPVPDDFAQFPKSWVVEVKYEIDDLGNILFPDYDFEEIGGYLVDVSVDFDETDEYIILNVVTTVGDGVISGSDVIFGDFVSGKFQVYFAKK